MGMRSLPLLFAVLMGLHCATARAQPPDDPQFELQWGLNNTGQEIAGRMGTDGLDVAALSAWEIHAGSSTIVVAIVGTGIDPHPEFADRLLEGFATTGDPFNSLDMCPHGTHLAGIIAAAANNGAGIAGLNGRVRLLPVRVLDGCAGRPVDAAEGIYWAVDHGADIILVPLEFEAGADVLGGAISHAGENDVIIIASAGHAGNNEVSLPAALPGCLAVSAVTNDGKPSSVSNYGSLVDLAAPGRDIWSTWINGQYGFLGSDGDSAAASAFVAGVAALVRSYAPQLSATEVVQVLIDSTDDLGELGWDPFFGAGQVNARTALELAEPPAMRFEHVEPFPTRLIPGRTNSFVVRIASVAEEVVPASARLMFRRGPGLFDAFPLTPLDDDLYLVTLPATECEAATAEPLATTEPLAVEFFLSATGSGGGHVRDPLDAPTTVYSAEAVVRQALFVDDFESDLAWTVEAEGSETKGGWCREAPVGTTAQPGFDHSPDGGTLCYFTGQHTEGLNDGAGDVDYGPVRLTSPAIELPAVDDVEVSYARWFYWNGLGAEDSLIVELSRDNGTTWTTVETVSSSGEWNVHRFRLSEFPQAAGDRLRVRFTTADLPNDSLTEAAIDDFRVEALRCSVPPGDANLDDVVDRLDFQRLIECWTGPTETIRTGACSTADFDDNLRVDLRDAQILQAAFAPH